MKAIIVVIQGILLGAVFVISVWFWNWISPFKPSPDTIQIAPECPKGLAESATQKKYDYDQSQAEQAAFQAMRKGPR